MLDFWMPRHKYEFVYWLEEQYPKDKQGRIINWNKFPLKRLQAIYIGIRTDYENSHVTSGKSVGIRQGQKQDSPIFANATREISNSNPVVQRKESQEYFDFGT